MILRPLVPIVLTLAVAAPSIAGLGGDRGVIVPLPARKLKIVESKKGPVAHFENDDVSLDTRLSTKQGFVFLDIKLENMGAKVLELGPGTVTLLSEGTDEVDPVTPQKYAELAYDVSLSDTDLSSADEHPSEDERDSSSRKKKHHRASPELRDFNHSGRSVSEAMADPTSDDSSDQDRHRKEAIAEVRKLQKDPVLNGGPVPPGTTVHGRMIYLRSHCDPPFLVKVKLGSQTVSIRFARR